MSNDNLSVTILKQHMGRFEQQSFNFVGIDGAHILPLKYVQHAHIKNPPTGAKG